PSPQREEAVTYAKNEEGENVNARFSSAPHVTGALLILGCVVVLIGATPYGFVNDHNGPTILGQPPQEWVRLVFAHPPMRVPAFALLGWAVVQLVGAVISVGPLGFLPSYPAQTVQRYLLHVVYAAAQVPLIVALLRYLTLMNQSKDISGAHR